MIVFCDQSVCEEKRATHRRPLLIENNGEPWRARTSDPLIKSPQQALRAKETLGVHQLEVVADMGYIGTKVPQPVC